LSLSLWNPEAFCLLACDCVLGKRAARQVGGETYSIVSWVLKDEPEKSVDPWLCTHHFCCHPQGYVLEGSIKATLGRCYCSLVLGFTSAQCGCLHFVPPCTNMHVPKCHQVSLLVAAIYNDLLDVVELHWAHFFCKIRQ
jgi:hypothetical protein